MQEEKKGKTITSDNQEWPLQWEDAACFGGRDLIKDFKSVALKALEGR